MQMRRVIGSAIVSIFLYSFKSILSQQKRIIPYATDVVVGRQHQNEYAVTADPVGVHRDQGNGPNTTFLIDELGSRLSSRRDLPEPLQVLEQYKQWHSVDSIRRNPHNRTYAMAYYSCPLQAGNRLHHFFNNLMWAVVTNRTVLWKYYDNETCNAVQSTEDRNDNEVCTVANTVDDCDPVLQRASWMASYDELADELKLPTEPLYLNFWSTRPSPRNPNKKKNWHPSYVNFTGVDARTEWLLVSFPIMIGMSGSLNTPDRRKQLLVNDWAREIARKLYSLGTPFLYGMIFRESFSMTPLVLKDIPQFRKETSDFTLAVHSRHSLPQFDGSNIKREQRCLSELLDRAPANSICRVYLMSDRPRTLERLEPWLAARNCTVATAPHERGESFRDEHGPWNGLGFFQDIALASQARHGIISKGTTSSHLLQELMEYDRFMVAWERGENATRPLLQCKLVQGKK